MTFKPGQTGNPGGRPKKDNLLKQLCIKASPDCFGRILSIAESSEDTGQRLKANQWICEYAYGKAAQAIEVGEETKTALTAVLQVMAQSK